MPPTLWERWTGRTSTGGGSGSSWQMLAATATQETLALGPGETHVFAFGFWLPDQKVCPLLTRGRDKKPLTLADVMCVHCTLYRPNWYLYFRVSDGRYRRTNYRIIVRNLSSRTSWQVPFILVTSLINHYICVCSPVHLLSVQNITFTFSTALCWWCTPVVHVCPLGPLGFLFLGPPEHRLALLQSQKSISVLTSISPSCINLASLTTRSNWKVRQKIEDNPHQGN